ncbi:hypothetical protein HGG76_23265 [Ochrobactrum tritici]|uniref:Uncharacterized protein n=1 Tax=Brucella tritici TaxID=94626 RepID=A0A7X6JBE3_9HYPH|nr:hypothetical protein [Brucella tritici]
MPESKEELPELPMVSSKTTKLDALILLERFYSACASIFSISSSDKPK